MHKLLERQLRKCFGEGRPGPELSTFVAAVDAAYVENDADRALLERSIELASAELLERNARLEHDLAAIRRLELELRQAEKLRAVGQLAAGVAHEINTPIQYVGDSIYFMRDAYGDLLRLTRELCEASATRNEPGAALERLATTAAELDIDYLLAEIPLALERASDGIQRVAGIVSAMKDFGRPDVRDKTQGDVNRCIENTLLVAQNELKYSADVEVSLGKLPLVPCFPGELSQVLLILLVNAAHAVAARVGESGRGRVRVESRVDERDVVITVTDNGCGIAPEVQERIFEPFFTTKPVGVGTGQGLAIARAIVVEKHGGTLSFESTPGVGTCFRVSLPHMQRVSLPAAAPVRETAS